MKDEKTGSEIFARIKQSLDSYQEDYVQGSWETYLQKSKARKRKLFLQIASGIAACLLVGFVGSELLLLNEPDSLKVPAEQTVETMSQKNLDSGAVNRGIETNPIKNQSDVSSPVVSSFASPLPAVATKPKTIRLAGSGSQASTVSRRNSLAAKENATSGHQIATNIAKDSSANSHPIAANQTFAEESQVSVNFTKPSEGAAILVGNHKTDSLKNRRDTTRVQAKFTVPDAPPKMPNQEIAETHKRKVRFGINFSPGVSTAKSSNSFNFTGGLSADISLFSNFQLTTGLQVENQNIVQKNPGMASTSMASSSVATSSATPSTTAPLNENRTKLINLDVPVNISWKFFSEKTNSYYVSAGLSSLVYLRQNNKNTTYSQDMIPVSSVVAGTEVKSYTLVNQVSVSENSGAPDQAFDFAGRVNIMVGFEKKLSNKLYIHIEPFAKIPASGLAPGNLNHTSTGINFKISF